MSDKLLPYHARRELLDFMVQGKINRGRHTDHPAGRHSIRTNQCPPPPSPDFFTGWMPFLPPNQQCQSTESTARQITSLVFYSVLIEYFYFQYSAGSVFQQLHEQAYTSQWIASFFYNVLPSAFHMGRRSFPHLFTRPARSVNTSNQCNTTTYHRFTAIIYRTTCINWHAQLRTDGFCCS